MFKYVFQSLGELVNNLIKAPYSPKKILNKYSLDRKSLKNWHRCVIFWFQFKFSFRSFYHFSCVIFLVKKKRKKKISCKERKINTIMKTSQGRIKKKLTVYTEKWSLSYSQYISLSTTGSFIMLLIILVYFHAKQYFFFII